MTTEEKPGIKAICAHMLTWATGEEKRAATRSSSRLSCAAAAAGLAGTGKRRWGRRAGVEEAWGEGRGLAGEKTSVLEMETTATRRKNEEAAVRYPRLRPVSHAPLPRQKTRAGGCGLAIHYGIGVFLG